MVGASHLSPWLRESLSKKESVWVAHFDPCTWEAEADGSLEFKVSPIYRVRPYLNNQTQHWGRRSR